MKIEKKAFEKWQEPPKGDEIRLIPLGGVGEFGMNTLVVHTAQQLFLVDCGQLFPSDDEPGIDSIIPDFAYLEPFADQLDGVILTHGHEDHLGALPYFLEKWPVPVYGTAFTLGLLESKMKEWGLDRKLLRQVEDFDRKKIGCGPIEAEWIPVTHSIPDACAIALHTPQGVILHTGDFKLDPTPVDGRLTGTQRLEALGQAGVRLLLSDSTNVIHEGRGPSEAICQQGLRQAFVRTPGKLFVSLFSSHIARIQTLLNLAYENHRKVVVLGRSLERNIGVARELKRLMLPDDLFIPHQEAHLFKPEEILVLCTGSQGEAMSGLNRIIRQEVKGLRIVPGDRLVLSSRAIPGNEVMITRMLDNAARQGADTFMEELGFLHASGHGCREEAADMIRMTKPHFIAPLHGTYRHLQAHSRLAESLGYGKDKIVLLEGGDCLQFREGTPHLPGVVPVGKLYVEQGVEHNVDARVIHDRLIMQEDGIVIATLQVNLTTGEKLGEPAILSRGFVMLSDDEAYGTLLKGTVNKAFEEAPLEIRQDKDLLIELLRQSLRRIIRKTTDARPMVVPMILPVTNPEECHTK